MSIRGRRSTRDQGDARRDRGDGRIRNEPSREMKRPSGRHIYARSPDRNRKRSRDTGLLGKGRNTNQGKRTAAKIRARFPNVNRRARMSKRLFRSGVRQSGRALYSLAEQAVMRPGGQAPIATENRPVAIGREKIGTENRAQSVPDIIRAGHRSPHHPPIPGGWRDTIASAFFRPRRLSERFGERLVEVRELRISYHDLPGTRGQLVACDHSVSAAMAACRARSVAAIRISSVTSRPPPRFTQRDWMV